MTDTQAPERLDLYFTHGKPLMKAAENGRYVRSADYDALRDLADARAAAIAHAMREAAASIVDARKSILEVGTELSDRIRRIDIPEDRQAALDRLIAERVREAYFAGHRTARAWGDDVLSANDGFANFAARASKENLSE